MFSRDLYEILHILGIALIFMALGGVAVHAANGGARRTSATRGLVMATHGIGSVLILLGGFGMMARMGMMGGFPGWIWGKLLIWLILSLAIVLPYRVPAFARPALFLLPLFAAVAVYLALYKPF
jgi:hypothetical protein